jgi:phenylalanyl-tRNA synthetase beta chain
MAIIVDDTVSSASIIDCIKGSEEPTLQDASLFDIYRGPGVEAGSKSVALSIIIQNSLQTLTDVEIDGIFNRILQTLIVKLGAKLRD